MTWLGRFLKLGEPGVSRVAGSRWRAKLAALLGLCLFMLGLIVGIYLFFPAETLRQRIVQELETKAGMQVQIKQLALYPLLTVAAGQASVDIPGLAEPLQIESVQLAPQWLSLLSKDPGARLQASLMNGTVNAGWHKSGLLRAEAVDLRFDVPVLTPFQFNLSGTLSRAFLATNPRLDPNTETQVSLQLADVKVVGLEMFNAREEGISLGDIFLQLDGKGRVLRIKALTVKGGLLDVAGEGTLMIGRTAATSRIRLALQLRPDPNADSDLTSLLALAGQPEADGRYLMQLTGTLAQPVFKPED